MQAPFPAFGGKSAIAPLVWQRFGRVRNHVEPFANSAAVALAAPYVPVHETWNDLNGHVANFWRATRADPDAVAEASDWPVNEADLHARHGWLVRRQEAMTERLMGDPDWCDPLAAGWWLWGICAWIGSGWCSGEGPWTVNEDGRLVNGRGAVVWRQLPHLGDAGMGINRQLPHLGGGRGINRKRPHLGNAGRGINRQLPHLGDAGRGINRQLPHGDDGEMGACAEWSDHLRAMMGALRDRLRRVRVCCGDWSRVCGPTPTFKLGLTSVLLDPPYQIEGRDAVYDNHDAHPDGDNSEVFYRVVEWARANGENPLLRIAVCGYHEDGLFPESWECVRWKSRGGYAAAGSRAEQNATREAVWFSPACERPDRPVQGSLFEAAL
jgi:hypothetical protein